MSYIPDCREDESYNEKYLNETDKEYIRGYDYAVEEVLETFFANLDCYDFRVDGEDIDLGLILENHESIADKLKDAMKQWFESERDQMITSMIDHMDDNEYEQIKEKVDKEEYELGKESEEQED
jgi:hypothetical protein